MWHHGFPALGIPGAMSWKPEWAEFLNDFPTIYLCVEPDKAGQALLGKLANSPLAPKVHVIAMEDLIDEGLISRISIVRMKTTFGPKVRAPYERCPSPSMSSFRMKTDKERKGLWEKCKGLGQRD